MLAVVRADMVMNTGVHFSLGRPCRGEEGGGLEKKKRMGGRKGEGDEGALHRGKGRGEDRHTLILGEALRGCEEVREASDWASSIRIIS